MGILNTLYELVRFGSGLIYMFDLLQWADNGFCADSRYKIAPGL